MHITFFMEKIVYKVIHKKDILRHCYRHFVFHNYTNPNLLAGNDFVWHTFNLIILRFIDAY